MRSVVEVITTRTPAAYSRRATAKPIPSALPAPVITAVCLFKGKCMGSPKSYDTSFTKDCDSPGWGGLPRGFEAPRHIRVDRCRIRLHRARFSCRGRFGGLRFLYSEKQRRAVSHGTRIFAGANHEATGSPSGPE